MPLALTAHELGGMRKQYDRAHALVDRYKDKIETVADIAVDTGVGLATGFALGALDAYGRESAIAAAAGKSDAEIAAAKQAHFGIVGVPGTLGIGVAALGASFWLGPKAAPIARSIGTAAISCFGYSQGRTLHKDADNKWAFKGGVAMSGELPDGGARGGTKLTDEEIRAVAQGRV